MDPIDPWSLACWLFSSFPALLQPFCFLVEFLDAQVQGSIQEFCYAREFKNSPDRNSMNSNTKTNPEQAEAPHSIRPLPLHLRDHHCGPCDKALDHYIIFHQILFFKEIFHQILNVKLCASGMIYNLIGLLILKLNS